MTTRRRFLETVGGGLTGGLLTRGGVAGAGGWLARGLPLAAGAAVLGWPRQAHASTILNPENISNFTLVGGQSPSPGPALLFNDANDDVSGLFAPDPDAGAGTELDLQATFQVTPGLSHGVDAGFQVVINDGPANRAAIAACILINGLPHIGLVSTGPRDLLATYGAFVQAEWHAARLTIRLRRTAEGGAQLLEVNGVPPNPAVELLPDKLPPRRRAGTTVELGCFSGPATVNVAVTSFYTETRVIPVSIKIKPGSDEPSINLASAGVIPVAILSSPTFDATQVVPASVSLAGAKVKLIGKAGRYSCSFEDVNGDGRLDLMCHVETASFFLETGESLAVLEAETYDGQAIRGQQTVRIVP